MILGSASWSRLGGSGFVGNARKQGDADRIGMKEHAIESLRCTAYWLTEGVATMGRGAGCWGEQGSIPGVMMAALRPSVRSGQRGRRKACLRSAMDSQWRYLRGSSVWMDSGRTETPRRATGNANERWHPLTASLRGSRTGSTCAQKRQCLLRSHSHILPHIVPQYLNPVCINIMR